MSKPALLFVLEQHYPHVGGVESLFQALTEELVAQGFLVTVLTAALPHAAAREVHRGVEIIRIPVPAVAGRYAFTFLAFWRVLSMGRRFEVIHTTTFNAALPAALAGWLLRKKVIITIHELWGDLWFRLPGLPKILGLPLYLYEKLITHLPYWRCIAVSHATLAMIKKVAPGLVSRTEVIHNGVNYDVAPFNYVPPASPAKGPPYTILCYGRPGLSKGLDFLIEAFNACVNENVRLRLIVSREAEKPYERLKEKILNSQISIEPSLARAELFQAITEADYVIIPSLSEGFGFAALEACICGKKLICSNQASLPEVVYGDVLFYNPWNGDELIHILNNFESQIFKKIPEKRFPLSETVDKYITMYG